MELSYIPAIMDRVKTREEDFGCLVFTNYTPILSFNSDAYSIWKLIDGKRSVADIISVLGVGNNSNMVIEFLSGCKDLNLICNGSESI